MGAQRDQICLQQLTEATRRVDFRRYEEGHTDSPRELLYTVLDILDDGIRIASKIRADYEQRSPSGSWDLVPAAGEVDPGALAEQRVADVCFMACHELRGKVQPLSVLKRQESYGVEVFILCSDALRKVRKVATAIEHELCRARGLEPLLHADEEVEAGIEIRRAFALLRKTVLGSGQPGEGALETRLRASLAAIEDLMGQSLFYSLRFSDRHQLRQLRRRLHDRLHRGEAARSESGTALWQDLAGFVELLKGINNRSELQEHDRTAVEEIARLLEGSGKLGSSLPLRVHVLAATLFGRFDRLDELLEQGVVDTDSWCGLFRDLKARMEPSTQTSEWLRDAV